MPEVGSETAVVKFLTPEACQTYLDATENGIEIKIGEKKTIVFVDRQPEPSSINDVIEACTKGNASRCVRATGADDDWSNAALIKLAHGKQQIRRDVDCIKQGKTASGVSNATTYSCCCFTDHLQHHFIEFRFGNIYHALNFKSYIMQAEEWEHCSVSYALDPCELARGVHDSDVDEKSSGEFAGNA